MQVSLLQSRFATMLLCLALCICIIQSVSAQYAVYRNDRLPTTLAHSDNSQFFSTPLYRVSYSQERFGYESGVQTISFIKTQTRATNDTVQRRESRISKHFNNDDILRLWLTVADEQTVDFSMFNLLGKKVKDFGRQSLDTGVDMQLNDFNINDVPNGVYVVVAQGTNFRSAIKITLARQ
jgi:hypothetical protein